MLAKPQLSSDPVESNCVQTPRVDVERFRAELREHGVEEVMGALLSTFVQDAPGRFADLEHAVQGGNAKDIESAAHAFKSGAGTIRATVLADGLDEAEAAGRAGKLESITGLLEQIRSEYMGVVRELEATLSQMPTSG
jgi:HPt (histidine-containing phosphotransfer) domain-containing protein